MTVAKQGNEPIGVANADVVVGARRAAVAVVVLRAAVDVVEGLVIVDSHLVILGNRHVVDEAPRLAQIEALVDAAVIAHDQIIVVVRIERHGVMVDVFRIVLEFGKRLAAVLGDVQMHVGLIHAVELVRAREQFLVVVWPGAAGQILAALLPGLAAVGRAPEAAGAVGQLDRCIDHVRINRRNRDAGLAHVFFRQTFGQLAPGFAAINGFVNARPGSTVHQHRYVTQPLPGDRKHHVRIARVHMHFIDARILVVPVRVAEAVTEHLAPGLAAVGRLEQAAIAAAGPQRSLRGDEDRVRIARVDANHADVLGVFQTHAFPIVPAVQTAIDTRAVADMPA